MKFSCERCGKKYATADKPAPGKVYKLRCKACGHLIVVKAAGAGATPVPAPAEAFGAAVAQPAPEPLLELSMEVDAPAGPPTNGAAVAGLQFAADLTTEVSTAPETAATAPAEEAPRPPASDPGYVDLFSDMGGSGAADLGEKQDDPFLAAARASLPEAYGATGSAPDPFGPLRQEAEDGAPPPPPKIPDIPKPPPQKSSLPLALIGAGVAVLVGILAFVLLGAGSRSPGLPAPQVHAQQQPPPVAPPAQAPAPVQEAAEAPPPAAEPPPAPAATAEEDRRPREERSRREPGDTQAREAKERRAREAREARERRAREERAEREAKERRAREERAEREAKARERRERERLAAAAVVDEGGGGGLGQDRIEAVLRSTKKAFDGCLQGARGGEPKLDGRQVMLRLNIQPSGAVTYPTLDDVTLNGTELGSCLKSAARLMVFPRFKGDTLHVEVPLVLR